MQKIVMLTFSLVIKNLVEFMRPLKSIFYFPSSIFPLVVAFLMLLNLGCKKSPTEIDKPPIPPTPPSLELSVDGVSCTEAWIKVKKLNDTTFLPISLKINEKEFYHGFLVAADTVLFVDSLAPNTTYTVKGIILDTLQTAKELKVTTLPTTNHNYTWQTFTFGEHSSSVLNDVAIIDENNIWAVGEIYMNDSLGYPDSQRYNALHWDGNRWEIKRIPYNYEGTNYYHPIQAVFAFGTNDVWFCGNGVIHWNGSNFLPISISTNIWGPYQMNKIWGSSSNDLYVVGYGGGIAHYDGKNWQKIESGTDLNFFDIYGTKNNLTGDQEILAVASYVGSTTKRSIVQIKGSSALQIYDNPINYSLTGIWFMPNRHYYVVGAGIYEKRILTDSLWKNGPLAITKYYTNCIRGSDVNNVIVAGAYGEVLHFNGTTWKSYMNSGTGMNGSYINVAAKENLVVLVGSNTNRGIITIGRN